MAKTFNSQQEHDAYVAEKKKNKTIWGVIMASSLGTSFGIAIAAGIFKYVF